MNFLADPTIKCFEARQFAKPVARQDQLLYIIHRPTTEPIVLNSLLSNVSAEERSDQAKLGPDSNRAKRLANLRSRVSEGEEGLP